MKAVNLINQALEFTNEPCIKALLSDFLRANTIVKNEKFDLTKYVSNSKSDTDIKITGIFHEKGFRIATNAYILCVVNQDYPVEYEGKIITPNGQEIEGKFPAWQLILPNDEDLTGITFTEPVSEILQRIKEEQKVAKIDDSEAFVKLICEEKTIFFNAKMFVLFLNFMKTFKDTNIGIRYCGINSYICAKDDNGNLCMLMCFNTAGKKEYVVEIHSLIHLSGWFTNGF